jgi:hypothetical protein
MLLHFINALIAPRKWDRDKFVATSSSGDWGHNMTESLGIIFCIYKM